MPFRPPEPERVRDESGGLPENVRGIAAAGVAYIEARLRLANVEGKEAAGFAAGAALMLAAGAGFLFLAYSLLIAATVGWIARVADIRWELAAAGLALLHLIGGFVMIPLARRRMRRPFFETSIQELKKDREWLEGKRRRKS